MRRFWAAFAVLTALLLGGCSAGPPAQGTDPEIAALARALKTLSPTVSADDAMRAANLAYAESHRLALAYEITDPPLVHNAKVNAGRKPRGLCYHWAEDMERRLNAEGFATLRVTRAIANSETRLLIDHSTAVLTAKGAPMESGIIIDPWRHGGRLFWAPVAQDRRYTWKPRIDVLRKRGLVRYAHRSPTSQAALPSDLIE